MDAINVAGTLAGLDVRKIAAQRANILEKNEHHNRFLSTVVVILESIDR